MQLSKAPFVKEGFFDFVKFSFKGTTKVEIIHTKIGNTFFTIGISAVTILSRL